MTLMCFKHGFSGSPITFHKAGGILGNHRRYRREEGTNGQITFFHSFYRHLSGTCYQLSKGPVSSFPERGRFLL